MPESIQQPDIYPQCLCSEIQLFDLCDLNSCRKRSGRYCSDSEMLGRFENITEKELRVSERFISEKIGDTDSDDDSEYRDDYEEDGEDESEEE